MAKRLALILVLGLAACGSARGGATSALDKYGQRLGANDYEGAYALMSSSFRAKVSREEFVRMMRENPREVSETAHRLD